MKIEELEEIVKKQSKELKKISDELKNTRENNRFLVKELEDKEEKESITKTQPTIPLTIYFCDVCQTNKNNKVDGEVYQIKISIRPNTLSNVCPTCRPNVVAISDDNWKDF